MALLERIENTSVHVIPATEKHVHTSTLEHRAGMDLPKRIDHLVVPEMDAVEVAFYKQTQQLVEYTLGQVIGSMGYKKLIDSRLSLLQVTTFAQKNPLPVPTTNEITFLAYTGPFNYGRYVWEHQAEMQTFWSLFAKLTTRMPVDAVYMLPVPPK